MAQDARRVVRGFTLTELMATLAVLAVLVTIGIPAFASILQRAREANTYHLLTSSLAAARVAAIRRNVPVTVCPSSDGVSCRGDAVWRDGWILFADPERADQPAGTNAILQRVHSIGAGIALRSTNGRTQVRFTPDGWSYGSNLSIRLCTVGESRLLGKVVVNNAGRPRSERAKPGAACPYVPQVRQT